MNHHGEFRFCLHARHMAPTEGFRLLPGVKIKRWVCERCYGVIMEARERVKLGDMDAREVPF